MAAPSKRLYSRTEAAAYLGVTIDTIKRLEAMGELRATRFSIKGTSGRQSVRYDVAELEGWIKRHTESQARADKRKRAQQAP